MSDLPAIPTLRDLVRTEDPEIVANTRDHLISYAEAARARRDTIGYRDSLKCARVTEWEMAQRWPANPNGVNRTDGRPPLSADRGNDSVYWQQIYAVGQVDVEDILARDAIEDLVQRAFRRLKRSDELGYVGSVPGQKSSNEWFTPTVYIDSARAALGGTIGLDPFSSPAANTIVGAERFYTIHDDALAIAWANSGTVFMNPPYSAEVIGKAVAKYLDEHGQSFDTGVVLVNNATETSWFQRLLLAADVVCFTNHRISFWNIDGKPVTSNTRGQAFLFHGRARARFSKAFEQHGAVIPR